MEKKKELDSALVRQAEPLPLLAIALEFNHLKQLYRQGWLRRGISPEQCETVAEHILGVALLAWTASAQLFPAVDRDKAIRMALVHDLGEVYVGDLTPGDGVSTEEKHRREREALGRMAGRLEQGGQEYVALWEEYEQNQTPEAQLVRQLDKLEMALQALAYERQGGPNLDEFFRSAEEGVSSAELRTILDAIQRMR